jgi:beta-N-acetylhexosaminidase
VHTLEHQAIAADLASRSIMLLRNQSVLPFQPLSPERTLIVGPTHHSRTTGADVSYVELLANMIRSAAVGPAETFRTAKLHPVEGEIEEAVRRARVAHRVVALTYSAGEPSAAQGRLVRAIASTGKRLVAVSTGTPYDIQEYPDVPAAIACCALGFVPIHLASPGVLQAAVDVIFGAASHGRLPVHISARYPLGHGLTRPAATRG